jgi:hypothetical protein
VKTLSRSFVDLAGASSSRQKELYEVLKACYHEASQNEKSRDIRGFKVLPI